MADNKVNKIVYGNDVLIDLTSDTVSADNLLEGYTAHDKTGNLITGTAQAGDININGVEKTCVVSGDDIESGDFISAFQNNYSCVDSGITDFSANSMYYSCKRVEELTDDILLLVIEISGVCKVYSYDIVNNDLELVSSLSETSTKYPLYKVKDNLILTFTESDSGTSYSDAVFIRYNNGQIETRTSNSIEITTDYFYKHQVVNYCVNGMSIRYINNLKPDRSNNISNAWMLGTITISGNSFNTYSVSNNKELTGNILRTKYNRCGVTSKGYFRLTNTTSSIESTNGTLDGNLEGNEFSKSSIPSSFVPLLVNNGYVYGYNFDTDGTIDYLGYLYTGSGANSGTLTDAYKIDTSSFSINSHDSSTVNDNLAIITIKADDNNFYRFAYKIVNGYPKLSRARQVYLGSSSLLIEMTSAYCYNERLNRLITFECGMSQSASETPKMVLRFQKIVDVEGTNEFEIVDERIGYIVYKATDFKYIRGVAKNSGSEGDEITCVVSGFDDMQVINRNIRSGNTSFSVNDTDGHLYCITDDTDTLVYTVDENGHLIVVDE